MYTACVRLFNAHPFILKELQDVKKVREEVKTIFIHKEYYSARNYLSEVNEKFELLFICILLY